MVLFSLHFQWNRSPTK